MRIFILGCGAQGSTIAGLLSKEPDVEAITCADISLDRARRLLGLLREHGTKAELEAKQVNAGDKEQVAREAKGFDVIVNATWPVFNIPVMEASLEAGAHYLDLAASPCDHKLPHECYEGQLKLDDAFKEADLTAFLSIGVTPGLSDVEIAYVARRMDRIDEIRIRWADRTVATELVTTWSPEILLDEFFSGPIVVYEDGRYREVHILRDAEYYELPTLGRVKMFPVNHEELFLVPRFLGKEVRYLDVKGGVAGPMELTDVAVEALVRALAKHPRVEEPGASLIEILASTLPPPIDFRKSYEEGVVKEAVAEIAVDVRGTKGHRNIRHVVYTTSRLEEALKRLPWANHISYATCVPATEAILMLGRGEIKRKGIMAPEHLDPEPFLKKVMARGIRIRERIYIEGDLAETLA